MAAITRFRMPTDAHSHIHPPRWYSQKPRDGAKAMAKMVDSPQYPIPSARAGGGNEVGHVGGGRRQKARPEAAVDEGEAEEHAVVAGDRVGGRERGQDEAARDEHPPPAEPVGQRSRDRRGEGRGVGQEPEEHSRRDLAASELEDAIGRGGQELERGEEDGEAEPAHDEEAGGEEGLSRRQVLPV